MFPGNKQRLATRALTRLENIFHYSSFQAQPDKKFGTDIGALLLTAPSDRGVELNGGRIGARYSPQAILASLSKLVSHQSSRPLLVAEAYPFERSNHQESEKDLLFCESQQQSENKILQYLHRFAGPERNFPIIHLGGGHDHVLPLLKALKDYGYKKVKVINIDAHADTRDDEWSHSGNPFRLATTTVTLDLLQYGLHSFANTESTLKVLPTPSRMQSCFYPDLQKLSLGFNQLPLPLLQNFFYSIEEKNIPTAYVFSLDCDALEAQTMEAVSAVNHQGIPARHVTDL